jgi:hypothetical protein
MAEQHADYERLLALVNEALQDGPWVTDRDGYSWCWFCGGDGAWEKTEVEHEGDCVWVRIETLINPAFAAAQIDGSDG